MIKFKLDFSCDAYKIILLAVDFAMDVVEGLASKSTAARTANKTRRVVEVTHRLTRFYRARHLIPALVTLT